MDKEVVKRLLLAKKNPIFFAEHFFNNVKMEPYKLEAHQKLFLNDKSPYKILFCSRRSGKTLVMILDILHKAFFRPNQQIALIAPTLEQSKTFANVFNDMILRSKGLKSSFIVDNKLDKQLSNGTRIAFKTAGAASGKKEDSNLVGSGINTLYIDEAQSMDAESMATIMPVVTGQIGQAEIVLAGTPRARTGFFFENILNAKQISECYVNNGKPKPCPTSGKYSLHRFKVTDLDEDDKVIYSRAEYRLSIEELETIKSTIGVEKFRREYCLEFLDSISMPFYSDLIDLAFIAKPEPTFSSHAPACAGLDFGKQRNISSLTIAVQTPQQTWEAKFYKRWHLGTPYNEILHYINNIMPKAFPNLRCLAFDKTGVGNVLAENINHNSFYEVLDVIFSQPSKVGMVEGLVSSMESQFLTFLPDKLLEKEMSQYSRETTENDRVIYTKGESDDCIDSAMLCNMAINYYLENGVQRTSPLMMKSLGQNILKNNLINNEKSRNRYTKKRKK